MYLILVFAQANIEFDIYTEIIQDIKTKGGSGSCTLRISHIEVHDICTLFSSTSFRIYDREIHKQVKVIIFNKLMMK